MATPFLALVEELRGLQGNPKVTYPEGDATFPISERVFRLKRGEHTPTFRQAEPDAARFPSNTLTEHVEVKSDAQWVEVYRKYEVLPGPVITEVTVDQDTGIPILISRQKVSSSAQFITGEITFGPFNVDGITDNGNGTVIVALTAGHGLPPGAWVTFEGTNSTPPIDGARQILAVPSGGQLIISATITVFGTGAGTMSVPNRVVRELQPTSNGLIKMKIESMLAVADVSEFNEDLVTTKEYSFPDTLLALNGYTDLASETSSSSGSVYELSTSFRFSGGIEMQIAHGYRGPCVARRKRIYFSGPPPDNWLDAFPLLIIKLSSATIVVRGGSNGHREMANTSPSFSESDSTSWDYKTVTVPPVLSNGITAVTKVGGGQADFVGALPASSPTSITTGDTIYLAEQPQKLRVSLWQAYVWAITVP